MSSIEKLLIQGVRSFSPEKHDVIQFWHPLTLIVGPNGCGKTTIIECLKYITTGEMPPNSKGGAFVHDPKVCGESVVKARIKLKFQDVSGNSIVVSRAMESTQKKNKITTKTLEGCIEKTDANTKEATSVSAKCVEIDREMVSYLGVDKAVLSNVIFCHQEDSNWPLDESKQLKTKFDAIFSATKYIKALDSIRKFRTEQAGKVREIKVDVKYLKQLKDKASQIRIEFEACRQQREQANEGIASVEEELMPVEAQLVEIERIGQRLHELQTELTVAESQRVDLARQNSLLRQSLNPEYGESDKELHKRSLNFQAHIAAKTDEADAKEAERASIAKEIAHIQRQMGDLRVQQGALDNAIEENAKRLQERNSLIKQVSRENHIDGFESPPFTDQQVARFVSMLQEKRKQAQESVDAVRTAYETAEAASRAELDDLSSRSTQLQESLRHSKSALQEKSAQLKRLQGQLAGLKVPDVDVATARRDKEDAEHAVQKLRAEVRHSKHGEEQAALERDRNNLRFELNQRKHEQEAMTSQLQTRTALEMKRRTRQAKVDERDHLLHTRDKDLKDLFSHVPQAGEVLRLHQELLRAREERHADAEKRMQTLQSKLSVNQARQKRLREELNSQEKALASKTSQLTAVVGTAPFKDVLAERKAAVDRAQEHVGKATNIAHVYKNFRKAASKGNNCPLCAREWGSPAQLADFLQEMDEKIAGSIPAAMEQRREALAQAKQDLAHLERLQGVHSAAQVLAEDTIPQIRIELSNVVKEGDRLQAEIDDDAEITVAETMQELNAAKELRADCERLHRLHAETQALEGEIAKDERLLPEASSDRTLEQVNEEINALNRRVDETSNLIDRVKTKIANQEREVSRAELRVGDAEKRVLEVLRETEAIERCQSDKQRLESEVAKYNHELASRKKQMEPLQSKLDDVIRRRQDAEADHKVSLRQVQRILETLEAGSGKVGSLEAVVVAFAARGTEQRRQGCQERLEDFGKKLQAANTIQAALSEQIQQLQRELASQESVERNIEDNIRFRKQQQEIATFKSKEVTLQKELQKIGGATLTRNEGELRERRQRLLEEKATLSGSLNVLTKQAKDKQKELDGKLYKGVDIRHSEKLIELRTTELANEDLNTYHAALDHAIMRFHSLKMEEINRTIKELWINTYQGNDIDYVEIRTDVEAGNEASSKRKSYNYRVVMMKGEHALDMRGRCSAGQKVLASILIRMALAETFCINCGIMTLDEPTTNMDRANIESLAKSLAEIIHARRVQSNFQLVVITHDEEFVQLLGHNNIVDQYYRVSKNENRCSTIQKQQIAALASA